jgi:REP element-mobilizing transposase RayT
MIKREWDERLFAYIGGTLNKSRAKLLAAGGMEDHIHVLASLPSTLSLADAAQLMKSNSSRFVHDELGLASFDWQKGYGAFSVSVSGKAAVTKYILRQKEHHQRKSFQEEYLKFLERHEVPYDHKYVFL